MPFAPANDRVEFDRQDDTCDCGRCRAGLDHRPRADGLFLQHRSRAVISFADRGRPAATAAIIAGRAS